LREQEWIGKASGGLCVVEDPDRTIERLVQFMAAGLEAPLPEASPQSNPVEARVSVERSSR